MTKIINPKTRMLLMFIGNSFIGLAIGISMAIQLGTDPYSTMKVGISHLFQQDFGLISILINAILLVFVLIKRRDLIGIGTWISMFGVGYVAQFTNTFLSQLVNPQSILQLIFFKSLALCMLGFAVAILVIANLGAGPFILYNVALTDMTKGRVSFKWICMANDFIFLAIGLLLGATVGVGTILSAFAVGPISNFFMDRLNLKIYGYKGGRQEAEKQAALLQEVV